MLPIPAFNPGDTVTYPNGNGVINVGAADAGSKMLLYNESPFNINIDFLNGSQSILHAWEARYWTLDGDTRQVEWDINSTLNVTSSPISLVIGELYNAGERLEGTYPMGLIRQTNVGNPGGIVSSASTIVNDGNALLEVIEATLSGHASSDVIVNNDGSFTLKGAGLLAAIGVLTHILGDLQVDGNLNGAFTISVNNVHGEFKAVPTGGMYFVDSGNNVRIAIDMDNTFIEAGTGNVQLQSPAGTTQLTIASTGITAAELVLSNGGIQLPNNVALSALDATAGSHDILKVAANNHVQIGPAGSGIDQLDGAGNIILRTTSTAVIANQDVQLATSKIADGSGNNLIDASTGGMVARGQRSSHNRFTYQGDGTNVDWFINAVGPSITGAASATVNHLMKEFGVSTAPNYFIMNPSTAGGSQTFGFNTITATQVNVVLGATNAYSFKACLL